MPLITQCIWFQCRSGKNVPLTFVLESTQGWSETGGGHRKTADDTTASAVLYTTHYARVSLTPLLPWSHLQTTNKSGKFETLKPPVNVNATQNHADVFVELSTLYLYFCDFASYSKRTAYPNSNALHNQTQTHCIPKLKRIAYPNSNALHTQT